MRKCGRCQLEKPLDAYAPKGSYCRACANEYNRNRYAEKRDLIRAQHNAWRAENRGKVAGYSTAYRAANSDKAAAIGRRWIENNPVRRFAAQSLGFKKRSGRVVSLTIDDVVGLWQAQDGKCALSGLPFRHHKKRGGQSDSPSLDRIEPALGYVLGNVRLLCYGVNAGRGTLTDFEFVEVCRAVVARFDAQKG